MIFSIPAEVREWVSKLFANCNRRLASKISRIPTIHETSLDLTFIECLSQSAAPIRFHSDWTLRLDTHYLGGMRHWGSWEIADIGILVLFRHRGRVLRSKIGLLQSKRLYPMEQDYHEDEPIDYAQGFGRLWQSEEVYLEIIKPRTFTFQTKCRYKALALGNKQSTAIQEYENKYKIPIYYNLYHPSRIPTSQNFPLTIPLQKPGRNTVGCRILPSAALHSALRDKGGGYVPSYGDLTAFLEAPFDETSNRAGWRLEHFVSDLLLECKAGYITTGYEDEGVRRVFFERGAPISAAISITIEAPEHYD